MLRLILQVYIYKMEQNIVGNNQSIRVHLYSGFTWDSYTVHRRLKSSFMGAKQK